MCQRLSDDFVLRRTPPFGKCFIPENRYTVDPGYGTISCPFLRDLAVRKVPCPRK